MILKKAADEELMQHSRVIDLFKGLEVAPPKRRLSAGRSLTLEEVTAFCDAVKGDRYRNLFTLALGTGMRIGEALALAWDDVEWKTGKLHIRHTRVQYYDGTGIQIDTPKTLSSIRGIDLDEDLLALLREQRKQVLKEGLGAVINTNGPVFPSKRGKFTSYTTAREHMVKALAKINLGNQASTHSLRRTFASVLIDGGVPIPMVSSTLGHANPAITAKVYSHPVGDRKAALAKMSSVIFSPPQNRDTQDIHKES